MKRIVFSLMLVVVSATCLMAERITHTWDSGLKPPTTTTINVDVCESCSNHQFMGYAQTGSNGTITFTGLNAAGYNGTEYAISVALNTGGASTNATTKTDFAFMGVNATRTNVAKQWGVKYWGW